MALYDNWYCSFYKRFFFFFINFQYLLLIKNSFVSSITFEVNEINKVSYLNGLFCKSLDESLRLKFERNRFLSNAYAYYITSPGLVPIRNRLKNDKLYPLFKLCYGTRVEYVYFNYVFYGSLGANDTFYKLYSKPIWQEYNAFTDFDFLFEKYYNSSVLFFSRLLNSSSLKTTYRSAYVRLDGVQLSLLRNLSIALDNSQYLNILEVLNKTNLKINVTTDRDFIVDLLYYKNYSRKTYSDWKREGYEWSIFSGIFGALEDVFVKIFVSVLNIIINDILEPFLVKFIDILWSLLPLFEKLIKLLSDFIKNLLCFIINLVYVLDKNLKIFEILLLSFIVLYYFSSIYMVLYSILIFFLLFEFQRTDNIAILATILEYTYSNSTCKLLYTFKDG